MRFAVLLVWVLAALVCTGCPERQAPDPHATQARAQEPTVVDETTPDDDPGDDDPATTEAPAPPLDVDHMSDEALQTACFEGRQAACDRLGH